MFRLFTPATKQAAKQVATEVASTVASVTHFGASVATIYTGCVLLSQNRRQPAHPQVNPIETSNEDKTSFQPGQ